MLAVAQPSDDTDASITLTRGYAVPKRKFGADNEDAEPSNRRSEPRPTSRIAYISLKRRAAAVATSIRRSHGSRLVLSTRERSALIR